MTGNPPCVPFIYNICDIFAIYDVCVKFVNMAYEGLGICDECVTKQYMMYVRHGDKRRVRVIYKR